MTEVNDMFYQLETPQTKVLILFNCWMIILFVWYIYFLFVWETQI